MTILLGIISSLLLELYKKISDRYGKKVTRKVAHLTLFGLSVLWVVLTSKHIISMDAVKEFVSLISMAVGTYELVLKNYYKMKKAIK